MFNLRKRIDRKTFLLGLLAQIGLYALFVLIVSVLPLDGTGDFEPVYDIPLIILLLTIAWRGIVLVRQRANDISGRNALLWLFLSLFLIGWFIGLFPGEKGENRYGQPAPLF